MIRKAAITAGLALALLGSAVGVVVSKHQSRALHTELASLRWEHDRLQTEWDQLQLEEATLAAHARVESQARAKLTMADPQSADGVTMLVARRALAPELRAPQRTAAKDTAARAGGAQ